MIADDFQAVRVGVATTIQGTDIELVCQAETFEQTVKLALASQPDVLLLDIRLGGKDGLGALEKIKREKPDVGVLIFSATEEVKEMALARKLGADGFVCKGVSRDALLTAIRRVAQGKGAWNSRQMRQVVCRASSEALMRGDRSVLSPREISVLKEIVHGCTNEAIAERLEVDIETVKQHVKHILSKLHVVDRTQAALIALKFDMKAENIR
jgi:DNA-binding NarL/FixJ family response regulator